MKRDAFLNMAALLIRQEIKSAPLTYRYKYDQKVAKSIHHYTEEILIANRKITFLDKVIYLYLLHGIAVEPTLRFCPNIASPHYCEILFSL